MRRVTLIASLETAPGEPKLIRTVRGAGYALKGA
jgi:DNA-binding response OmpR family regulator